MLDSRRRCGLRRRTFLAQERLRSVFVIEVLAVCVVLGYAMRAEMPALCASLPRPDGPRRLGLSHIRGCDA